MTIMCWSKSPNRTSWTCPPLQNSAAIRLMQHFACWGSSPGLPSERAAVICARNVFPLRSWCLNRPSRNRFRRSRPCICTRMPHGSARPTKRCDTKSMLWLTSGTSLLRASPTSRTVQRSCRLTRALSSLTPLNVAGRSGVGRQRSGTIASRPATGSWMCVSSLLISVRGQRNRTLPLPPLRRAPSP